MAEKVEIEAGGTVLTARRLFSFFESRLMKAGRNPRTRVLFVSNFRFDDFCSGDAYLDEKGKIIRRSDEIKKLTEQIKKISLPKEEIKREVEVDLSELVLPDEPQLDMPEISFPQPTYGAPYEEEFFMNDNPGFGFESPINISDIHFN